MGQYALAYLCIYYHHRELTWLHIPLHRYHHHGFTDQRKETAVPVLAGRRRGDHRCQHNAVRIFSSSSSNAETLTRVYSPLDLTKVRLQASGDKRMVESLKKTVRTAGVRGLFDGISGTWMRQMSYSMCRFWAYDESKVCSLSPRPRLRLIYASGKENRRSAQDRRSLETGVGGLDGRWYRWVCRQSGRDCYGAPTG